MIAGSVASSLHGRPRATQDADVVIDPTEEQVRRFIALLGQAYYVGRDAAVEAFRRRTTFNVVDLEGGWKADLIIRKDRPFSLQEFQRRRQLDQLGWQIWIVSPEDTILSKLEWIRGRESDVQYSDALGVAITQWENLDVDYLHKWAGRLGVENVLTRLLAQVRQQVEQSG
jgi:hypothetical protein